MSTTISSSTTGPIVLGTADNPLYITSTGTVTSTGSADGIDGGAGTTWTITNAGVVSAASGNGVSLAGSGIVGNTGSISGMDALVLKAGGSVTNNVGGSISGLGALGAGLGSGAGVYITGAAGTVTNNSTISGVAYGVGFGAGGLVTNTSAITGGEDGVIIQGAIGTIANSGSITATVDDGVALFAGGSVTNASGASISGLGTLGAGVFITGGVGTVTNAGSISGPNHHGVLIAGGGSLSNAVTGSISALGVGVFFETNPGTITNAGFITGTGVDGTGIYLENGGNATNASTGTITGNKFGAFLEGGSNTLANYGSISGATYDGVVLGHGGTVTNAAGASISGANGGIYVKYRAAGTVTNSGSISASGTGGAGIDLADGGSVTNNSTGSISGNSFGVFVNGAVGTVTNTGSIASVKYGAVELVKGGSVTNSAGASITGGSNGVYVGSGASGTVTNSGSISAANASGAGVDLAGGGNITNNSGGSISGGTFGVFTTGTLATLSNSGSISGSHGVGLEAGGSVTNAASGSIAGQTAGVFVTGGAATLSNAGNISATAGSGADIEGGGSITNLAGATISGSTFGVFLTGGSGTVTNAGTISGATDAIDLAGGGSITNNSGGSLSGSQGISLAAGGSVTNAASASISGQIDGVFAQGAAATLSNAGSISATAGAGADIEGGGGITNLAGATISGSTFGIFLTGGSGTVTNAGTISGATDAIDLAGGGSITNNSGGSISGAHGVGLAAGGSVTNAASASIAGQTAGVFVTGGAATLSNAGNISATAGSGADIEGGGSITNLAGATISGSTFGVFLTGGSGTVTNAGTISGATDAIDLAGGGSITNNSGGSISGSHGISLAAGGNVTNAASGSIAGLTAGVFAQGAAATLSNAGSISATAGAGADLEGGGGITNLAGATISGSTFGIFLTGGSGTVTNAGTISGGTYAIDFSGSATNRLVVDPGAVFVGKVIGGSGANTLELASGTGSIGGVGTGSLNNFQVLAVDAGATWTLNGANIAPTVLDDGTVNVAGSLDVSTAVDPNSTGLFQLGSGATLEVAADTGTATQVNFQGSSSELIIDNAASFGTNVGAASYAGPLLQAFAPGDKIDLKNFSSAGVTLSYNTSTGLLQVSNSANQVASLDFQTSSLASSTFAAVSDGVNGIFITDPPIEAFGSTSLVQVADNYFLDPVGGGTGPELTLAGAAVAASQVTSWTILGAEAVAGGYDVAWKNNATGLYNIWSVDSSGNYITTLLAGAAPTSLALESLETTFHQDLNGDGTIGPAPTVMEAFGSTSLVQVADNYFLDPVGGGTGPELTLAGAAVAASQVTSWTILGAEAVAGGYDVAWKNNATGLYNIWSVDSSGNYITTLLAGAAPTSLALESLETTFHQDLNGDGTIGPAPTVMEAFGSTSLVQVADNYFLDPVGGGTGPELTLAGAAVAASQVTSWTILGAEAVAGGYDVAWKNNATGLYNIWSVDSSGNYITTLLAGAAPTSLALESLETTFHQDLNGDGTIGPATTVIEAFGSTSLVQVADNYFLDPVGGGTGPELTLAGAAVAASQVTSWTILGAEAVAGGYDVAWKNNATGLYNIWSVDSSGNYITTLLAGAAPTSLALESLETTFHQELNGGPTLTISNLAPTVSAGGSIPLGVQVTPADADDAVSVTITGLTSYETITDNLDQTIFTGGSVTLSADEVNSGLTLHSSYGGTGHPVNNLIVTASNTTPGEAAAPATQTIVVTDPPVIAASPPQSIFPIHTVAMADFGSHGGPPPTGLAPSAYATLAGLLDQYMAAGSRHTPPGVTSLTAPQQALLGGDKEFLTKPHG